MLKGRSIDKEFEGGTRLTHCGHLVILPAVEIDIAHPCTYIARLRLHRHKTAMHELDHIADGIHRAHLLLHQMVGGVVVEHLDRMWQVHIVIDRVGIIVILLCQNLVVIASYSDVLDEVGNFLPTLIAPRRLVAPMAVESLLNEAHLLLHRLFGIALQTGVERRVYLQAIGVEVDVILLRPILQIILDGFAEMEGTPIVGFLDRVVEVDGYLHQRIQFLTRQLSMFKHIVQHHIAAFKAVLRVDLGVVCRGRLQQAHQHCRLLCCQVLRSGLEIGFGSRLDAKGIAAEIHRVEVERENVLLAVHVLNLDGGNPLLRFHDQDAQSRHFSQKSCGVLRTNLEEVLDQLLRDGAGTTRIALQDVFSCRKKPLIVNAVMLVETLILRGNQGINHIGGNLLEFHGRTVLVEELTNQHTVGAIHERSIVGDRILYHIHRGRHPEQAEEIHIHSTQIEVKEHEEGGNRRDDTLIPLPPILADIPSPT